MKKVNLLLRIFFIVEVIVPIITLISVIRLNMLPTLYIVLIGVVLLILVGITALLIFKKGTYKKAIVSAIVATIIILINLYGINVLGRLNKTMNTISNSESDTSTITYGVYVLSDDSAVDLEGISGYTLLTNDSEYINELQEKLGASISSGSLTDVVDKLYSNTKYALVLNKSYATILEETETYSDFPYRTKLLGEINIESSSDNSENVTIEDITNTPFIMYISGSDTRNELLSLSRSDVNILAVVNPNTKQILLINTPRDYYVNNPKGHNNKDKLTHLSIYGISNSMKALSELYGETINYSLQVNFTGFEDLIDAIGGITVNSPVAFTTSAETDEQYHLSYSFVAGDNVLDGKSALAFARERHALANGDNDRGKNQMRVISAIVDKLTDPSSIGTYLTNYGSIMASLEGTVYTDIGYDNISELVKMELNDMASWDIKSFSVTGTGTYGETYSMPGANLYIMEPNTDSVKYASKLIDKIMLNETISDDDVNIYFEDTPLDV